MLIQAKLAMWDLSAHSDRHLIVQGEGDFKALMGELGPVGAYVAPALDRVDFRPCSSDEATAGSPLVSTGNAGCVHRHAFRVGTSVLQMPAELPLFELMPIELTFRNGGCFASLPSIHRLPWPSAKSFRAFKDPQARAMEALEVRLGSAVASGLGNLGDNPLPSHVRTHLPPNAFIEARRTALILAGRES